LNSLHAQDTPRQLAVVYGASTAWTLAHLPNPAAHGPASTALGDSLKAEHHTPRQRKPNGDGDDGGSRPLKLLLAGELDVPWVTGQLSAAAHLC